MRAPRSNLSLVLALLARLPTHKLTIAQTRSLLGFHTLPPVTPGPPAHVIAPHRHLLIAQ